MHKIKVPIMLLCLCIIPFAHAKFRAPENLQIINSILSWDAVKNAAGYNIYLNDEYYATVKNSLLFELSESGEYKVVAFNKNAKKFSDLTDSEVVVYQFELDTNVQLPITGQILTFYPGDDGDWQTGIKPPELRFAGNGDGTFTDNFTGLTWLSVNHCMVTEQWQGAVETANRLAGDGMECDELFDGSRPGDWRLPNVREMQSLIDYGMHFPAIAESIPYTGQGFAEYPYGEHWTSTSIAVDPDRVAWVVALDLGHVTSRLKSDAKRVWPVRGGTQ